MIVPARGGHPAADRNLGEGARPSGVIAPLEELWITWVMKEVALKATYYSMLRGQA